MRRIFMTSFFLCLLFSSAGGWADDYTFVTLEYPPLEYAGKDGKARGAAVEVVTHIMKNLGHTAEIGVHEWSRGLNMVKEGEADAVFTVFRNPERETFLDFSGQILVPQAVYFYAKAGRDISYDGDLDKLKGLKIGVVSTISYGQRFDQARPRLSIEKTDSLEHNFRELLKGNTDLVISNSYTAEAVLKQLNFADRIERLPQEVEIVPSYIAFSKKRKLSKLRDQFDRELIRLKASGEYARVMREYGINTQ